MCLKHQFLSKYSIIFAKVAGCFVPRGVDRLDAEFVGALLRMATSAINRLILIIDEQSIVQVCVIIDCHRLSISID